jgi:glutamate N-acetyltransferase/amino-acid N-acetyltransferase
MGALGYSGSKVREELVDIHYNGLCAVQGGQASRTPFSRIRKVVRQRHYTITIDLHLGPGEYGLLVNDLTERYVTLNKGE